jgi:gamma-glutamyl-gamma-aminobutyrate hydrolase PuuD
MKPIIGLNMDVREGPPEAAVVYADYYQSVQRAGGIPVLLPPGSDEDIDVLLKQLNGLVLIGGPDYRPSHYGQEKHEATDLCHPARDDFDTRLMKRVLARHDMPVFGICLGAQLLNICLGGSLIQHIWAEHEDAREHRSQEGWKNGFTRHSVKVQPETELARIYKSTEFDVVSSHHQAIKALGEGLKAVAWAEDGIIEAIESTARPATIGVQWHPERDFEGNNKLFSWFVEQCASPVRPR